MNIKDVLEKHILWFNDDPEGIRANLEDANLRDANLIRANLEDANLRGANLIDANLIRANLEDANLIGANLIGANLEDANLRDANLRGANLIGANLEDANLRGANLRGANLIGANLRDAKGNNKEVVMIQTGHFTVVWTKEKIWIGCKSYPLEKWKKFTEEDVDGFDDKAVEFYRGWRAILLMMFEKFEKNLITK